MILEHRSEPYKPTPTTLPCLADFRLNGLTGLACPLPTQSDIGLLQEDEATVKYLFKFRWPSRASLKGQFHAELNGPWPVGVNRMNERAS